MTRSPHRFLAAILAVIALALSACSADAALPDAVRVGGPSAPGDSKVALVGSSSRLAGKPFTVVDASGKTVLSGKLAPATGKPTPWKNAARADLSKLTAPGSYEVRV